MEVAQVRRGLRDAGVPNAESISTFSSFADLSALYQLARECPAGAAALEIGSHLGASACVIAAGLCDVGGRLYCVDTSQNETICPSLTLNVSHTPNKRLRLSKKPSRTREAQPPTTNK